MVVEELYLIAEWVQREITDKYIENKYQDLINILNENLQPHNEKRPFENQRDELLRSIGEIYSDNLSEEQMKILAKLGIFENIGTQGIRRIEDTLYRNSLDLATVVNKLNQFKEEIRNGVNRLAQVKQGLDGVFEKSDTEVTEGNPVRIYFEERAAINNISDLNVRTESWHEIIRGITMLHDKSPEEVKVSGVPGESFTLMLKSSDEIIGSIIEVSSKVLEVIEKIVNILKKVEEIRGMNLSNKQIELDLEREADKLRKESIEKIGRDITMGRNVNGEVQRNLEKSIRQVFEFIENGGRIIGNISAEPQHYHEENSEEHSY